MFFFFFLSLSATSYLGHRECGKRLQRLHKTFTGEGDVVSFITKVELVVALKKN